MIICYTLLEKEGKYLRGRTGRIIYHFIFYKVINVIYAVKNKHLFINHQSKIISTYCKICSFAINIPQSCIRFNVFQFRRHYLSNLEEFFFAKILHIIGSLFYIDKNTRSNKNYKWYRYFFPVFTNHFWYEILLASTLNYV